MRLLTPVLLLLFLFALPGQSFSQTGSKLSGTVSDSSKPLALVTVRLLKTNTPGALQTVLTKENGSFQLVKPSPGGYLLSFTHTGFAEKQIAVTVASQQGDMQIDPVQLSRATGNLKEVVVNAKRPLIEQADDKIVFNVEDDPTAKTETAIDILRRTPFVTVDGEDNIKVNGNSSFKVLLNGRETSMFANNIKEALRGFPGVIISKIEVITIPSAKYDGEGIGGLINIITKKKVAGYNGTLSSFSRTSDKLNTFAVNGNAKLGNVGLSVFMNSGYTQPVSLPNTNSTIPTLPDAYAKRTLSGDQRSNSHWTYGNAELSWDLDSLNTVSLYSNINSGSGKSISMQTITTDFVSTPSTTAYYNLANNNNNPGVNVGSDYIRHFKSNQDKEF
ncbi:MAG TPA: carboxypeptidase regulatory-like domain-containing protein, partial [Chitinophagaceae bacterium]